MTESLADVRVTRVEVRYSAFSQHIGLYIIGETNEARPRMMYVPSVTMVEAPEPGSVDVQPSVILSQRSGAAQGLFDSLYALGLRPSKDRFQPEIDTAMKTHLDDMRKLVFESDLISWKK